VGGRVAGRNRRGPHTPSISTGRNKGGGSLSHYPPPAFYLYFYKDKNKESGGDGGARLKFGTPA